MWSNRWTIHWLVPALCDKVILDCQWFAVLIKNQAKYWKMQIHFSAVKILRPAGFRPLQILKKWKKGIIKWKNYYRLYKRTKREKQRRGDDGIQHKHGQLLKGKVQNEKVDVDETKCLVRPSRNRFQLRAVRQFRNNLQRCSDKQFVFWG